MVVASELFVEIQREEREERGEKRGSGGGECGEGGLTRGEQLHVLLQHGLRSELPWEGGVEMF